MGALREHRAGTVRLALWTTLAVIVLQFADAEPVPARRVTRRPPTVVAATGLMGSGAVCLGGAAFECVDVADLEERFHVHPAWTVSASVWWQEPTFGVGVGYWRTELLNVEVSDFARRKEGFFVEALSPMRPHTQAFGGLGWTHGRLGNKPYRREWSLALRLGVRVWDEPRCDNSYPMGEAAVVVDEQGSVATLGIGLHF